MRKLRMFAVFMAVVVTVSFMPGIVARADTISKEAQACKELGILIGADSSGVSPQYLSTIPTRIQAFIIVLRLKGLYSEAAEYEGEVNFKDASDAGWAKSYMAYGKSHPELGWGGYPDGTFAPSASINGQAFYKVMLETLGYKQDKDFTYAEALEFAQEIGLVKKSDDISKLKSFTVNDVAKGIYSALNTKPKDSDKKLITLMVEEDIITSEKAALAGFTIDAKAASVVSFNAVSNNRLELEFDQPLTLRKEDVEISQPEGSSRLSVLSVDSRGRKASITTTEAFPFSLYELTINTLIPTNNMAIRNYTRKFVAMPKDAVKPTVKHEIIGKNEMLLTFSEEVSRDTAENLFNYIIEDSIIIYSAEILEDNRSVVLRTSDMTRFYRLTVQGVCDMAGNTMDRYQVTFDGARKDTRGPLIVSVSSENSTLLTVTFDKRVDRLSAESIDNYSVDNGISVIDAMLDDTAKVVTLSTTIQQPGTVYNLTVQGVSDNWGNVMYRKEYRFAGDSIKPSVTIMAVSNNEVAISFSKKVDRESAENTGNYMIDKDLKVKEAILDDSGKSVTLITSDQTLREIYTVTVMQIYDLWGNTTGTYSAKFGGMSADTRGLTYAAKSEGGQLVLTFNKRLDKETAEDNFNYVLDKSLGYAARATLDASGKIVTLLTANHVNGRMYSVTVENVRDIFGNVISSDSRINTKKYAGVSGSTSIGGDLTLETAVTINTNTIDLIFSGELTEDELKNIKVKASVPEEYSYSLPSSLTGHIFFIGDKKNVRVQYETDSSKNPELFKAGNIYMVTVTGVDRLDSRNGANIKLFAGTGVANTPPEVIGVNALNNTAVEVLFNRPVKGLSKNQFSIKNNINISDISVAGPEEVTDTVILYISSSTKLADAGYKLYVKPGVKDEAGLIPVASGTDIYYEFEGTSDVNESPFVETDISILDTFTIQFGFNEPIKSITSSSFSIKKVSKSGAASNKISKAVLSDNKKTVTIYLDSRYSGLEEGEDYELTISSSVMDLQGLAVAAENRKTEFCGVENDPEQLEVAGQSINKNNDRITLMFTRELDIDSLSISDFEFSGAGYNKDSGDKVEYDNKSVTIILRNELAADRTFNIRITSVGRSKIKDLNSQKLTTEEVQIQTN